MELGYRNPMTYQDKPTTHMVEITSHVINLEALSKKFLNVEAHQYMHELLTGKDPRCSDWFKKIDWAKQNMSELFSGEVK